MKQSPSKAMILCAGLGTRMLPLSSKIPKPMMPVWGLPLIDRTINLLSSWGVDEILINLHHMPESIFRHILSRTDTSVKFSFSYEPEILGTGGALKHASWFFQDGPVWLINGDILAYLDPCSLITAHNKKNTLATTWLTAETGPRTVRTKGGLITSFSDPVPGSPGTYTFCGLHLLSPHILKYLSDEDFSSIIDAYRAAIRSGERVRGLSVSESFWADTGTPETYLEAHDEIWGDHNKGSSMIDINFSALKTKRALSVKGIKTSGFVCVDKTAEISPGATIHNSVILDKAVVGCSARIFNTIVAPHTRISGNAVRMAIPSALIDDKQIEFAMRSLGWNPDSVTVQPFAPRGSQRSFYRISKGSQSAVVVLYDPTRKENTLAVKQARFLKGIGVNVPSIMKDYPTRNMTIVQDVGDISLQSLVTDDETIIQPLVLYKRVLKNTEILHDKGSRMVRSCKIPLSQAFTPALYKWERDLFGEFFLRQTANVKEAQTELILADIASVSARLYRQDRSLLHRDLQSSNIIIKGKQPFFIDFQGMRFGPAVYDLASLLCDPYVMLPEETQLSLLDHYAMLTKKSFNTLEYLFWLATVQRLTQAVGAFSRLGSSSDTSRFREHIPGAVQMMKRALGHLDGVDNLKKFIHSFQNC